MWILVARQGISLNVTVKAFKKCCVSSAIDGADEKWKGSEDDKDVRSGWVEDQGTDSEHGDSDTDW